MNKGMRCIGCDKAPNEIQEYIDAGEESDMTPESYVEQEEGTYNTVNGHFACTGCFIALELKVGRRLANSDGSTWTAP